jgi:O-antigen ligase
MTSLSLRANDRASDTPKRPFHTLTAAVHAAAARGRDVYAAVGRFGLGLCVGGTVVGLSLVHGGYAPAAWGWTALLGFWATLLGLAFRSDRRVDRAGVALVACVTAVTGWTALSSLWTQSVPRTMLEVERDLVYVTIAAAVLLLGNSRDRSQLVWGLGGGLVVVIASAVGLYFASTPEFDATQGYLLFRPIGYANALGGLVVVALPLVLALAAHDARRAVVSAALASAVVLAIALYLAQNRAGYLALGIALVVWLSRTNAPVRSAAACLSLATAAGVAVTAVAPLGLFDTHRAIADVGARRVGAAAIVIALATVAFVLAPRVQRLRVPSTWVTRGARLAAALAGVALCRALVGLGDRAQYWHVAWRAFERHPFLGTGAGTFDEQWLRYRGSALSVRDAHSLYLETLSELGAVGLVLLVALLALPIVVSRRRRDPLTTACLGSYCAFLVHAAFEWDWEMPVVTVCGVLLASVLVRSGASASGVALGRRARFAAAAALAVAAVFAAVTLVGNSDVLAAERLLAHGDVQGAAARANRARHLLPWASEPWLVSADARARSLDEAGTRASLRAAISRDRADWALWFRLAAASRGNERDVALRRALALNPRLVSGVGSGR